MRAAGTAVELVRPVSAVRSAIALESTVNTTAIATRELVKLAPGWLNSRRRYNAQFGHFLPLKISSTGSSACPTGPLVAANQCCYHWKYLTDYLKQFTFSGI